MARPRPIAYLRDMGGKATHQTTKEPTMTTQYTISCGLDCPNVKPVKLSPSEARALVLKLALEVFPYGHTIREVTGRWQEGQPRLSPGSNVYSSTVTEPTIEVVWVAADDQVASGEAHRRVSQLAAAYKDQARQEAVMVTAQKVDSWMV